MLHAIMSSLLYSFLGVLILVICFAAMEYLTPRHNLRTEILEKKNLALAVLAGCFMLSVAIIIASAIH